MAKKMMKLVNPWTGEMECKVCHSVHFASIKPMSGGRYYRGSWQCQYGCQLPEKSDSVTESVKEVPTV